MSIWTNETDYGFGAPVNTPGGGQITSPGIYVFEFPYIQFKGTESGAAPSWVFQEDFGGTAWVVNAVYNSTTEQWQSVNPVASSWAMAFTPTGTFQILQAGPTINPIVWQPTFTVDPSGDTTQTGNSQIAGNLTVTGTITTTQGFLNPILENPSLDGLVTYEGPATLPQIYVSPSGNDSNIGTNPGQPLLTLQAAVDAAMEYDLGGNPNGKGIIVNLAAGTYTAGCVITGVARGAGNNGNNIGAQISFVGAGASTTTVTDSTMAATIIALNGAVVTISGITLTSTAGSILFPSYGAVIGIVGQCTFGASVNGQLHAETGGTVYVTGTAGYTISGGATAHWECVLGGRIILSEAAKTITLTGSPVFTVAFASMQDCSVLYCPNAFVSFSGSAGATTYRYAIRSNSVIETNAGTSTYLPGTNPGYQLTGGQYMPTPTPTANNGSGFGTGGALTFVAGSTDEVGSVQVTLGSSPTASGSFQFHPGTGGYVNNGAAAALSLTSGTASLQQQATTSVQVNVGVGGYLTFVVSNQGTNFPAGTFFVNYLIKTF